MLKIQRTFFAVHLIWISLLTLSLVYLASSLNIVSDITQFMPNTYKDKDVKLLIDELQQGNTARLLILRLSGDDAKKTCVFKQTIKIRT